MWTGKTLLSDLNDKSCWNVDFFCSENTNHSIAAFNKIPLRAMVEERRETIDPQVFQSKLFNYIGLENIQSLTGDLINFNPKYGKEIKSRSKIFCPKDILYGRLRPYLNKVYLADDPVSSGICSGEFYVLIPKLDMILPNFLRSVLASHYVQQYVQKWQTGSALPRLQLHNFMEIEIPLPPINIQIKYEKFLIETNFYRRQLAAELAELPQRTLDAIVHSIESGEDPFMPQVVDRTLAKSKNKITSSEFDPDN